MNLDEEIEMTVEEMVRTNLKVFHTDPFFSQQFPTYFHHYKKFDTTSPKPIPQIPVKAKRYLESKRVPRNHQIETNFVPYFKANSKIQKTKQQHKPNKEFDLADENQRLFVNQNFSLNALLRTNSPICASRLPSTPVHPSRPNTSFTSTKTRSNSFIRPERPQSRCFNFASTPKNHKAAKKFLLSTYKSFKLNSLTYSYKQYI